MGNMSWWFNGTGAVAEATMVRSGTPNYGLAVDLGMAPYASDTDYRAMSRSLADVIASQREEAPAAEPQEKTLWDRAVGVADAVVGVGQSAVGAAAYGITSLDRMLGTETEDSKAVQGYAAEAEAKGLSGMEKYEYVTERLTGDKFKEEADTKAGSTALEVLDVANEYAATTLLAESFERPGMSTVGAWREAHAAQQRNGWTAGEAFAAMFFDDEIVRDEDRIQKIREHDTVFNVSALSFNLIAAWKADPTVLAGKAAGGVRNISRGALAREGKAAQIQREVLVEGFTGGREAARAAASRQTGLIGRVQGQYGMSLFDRAQALREAARLEGAEKFLSRPEFEQSTNGPIMAQLFREVADSDEEFGLVFRTAIGDAGALEELRTMRGEIVDKLNVLEQQDLPAVRSSLESSLADYDAVRAERGEAAAAMEWIQPQDFFTAPDVESSLKQLEELEQRFQSYSTSADWMARALRGTEGEGLETGAIFNALDAVGPGKRSLSGITARVETWQHDRFSPKVRVVHLPRMAALRRVGAVSLHDPNEGIVGLKSSMDQLDHVTGKSSQKIRDAFFEQYASASTDVSRKNLLDEFQWVGWRALASRYGLDEEGMVALGKRIEERRGQAWVEMSSPGRWKRQADANRKERSLLPWADEEGSLNYLAADPMDVTQLANHYPMVNWVDLDHTIRMNSDILREVLGNKSSVLRKGGLMTARGLEQAYTIGGTVLNSFWKPLALFSLRWPMRVLGDEGYRTTHIVGALKYLESGAKGAGNFVFNTGQRGVRAYEWFNGRKVKTGPEGAESLRTDAPMVDPYDHRSQAAIPVDEWGIREADQKRHDALSSALSMRRMESTVEKRPKWAQQWDDRLGAAEGSQQRGFFFDPVSHKTANKGFAVSPYPGRLRTFDRKPTAREMNDWIEENADVFSIPRNRASVWLDKETGRWHLDVQRVFRTREDAMASAGRSGLDEFYDIEGGFTRYMDREDPYQHYSSPFVTGEDGTLVPDEPNVEIPDPDPVRRKKQLGFGEKVLRGPNGEEIVRPDIYGLDPSAPNVWMGVNSSSEMTRALYRGHTYMTGKDRAKGFSEGSVYKVGEPNSRAAKAWSQAWSQYVNKHVRFSPIWLRMLNGQSDDEIVAWLKTREGRESVRSRIGRAKGNPDAYVAEMRGQFDQLLPTPQARAAAAQRDLTPADADELVPFDRRKDIDGGSFLHLDSKADWLKVKGWVDNTYQWLASKPNDKFVRHPMASMLFHARRANFLASLPEGTIVTNAVMNAAEAEARAYANKVIKRTLYNIADEGQGVHMLRFVAPFAQAQYEVINRYLRLFSERPEALARTLLLFQGSNTVDNGLFYVTDAEGEEAEGFSHENTVNVRIRPWMRKMTNHFPGLKDALKYQSEFKIPVASLDLIMQGDMDPFTAMAEKDVSKLSAVLPGLGPWATIPANELYYKNRAELTDKGLGKYLFPVGPPKGKSTLGRLGDSTLPAWMKRFNTALTADMDDRAFYQTVAYIVDNQYSKGGHDAVNVKEAIEQAKGLFVMRAMSSFAMPFPVTFTPTNQVWIDRYRELREQNPETADEEFLKRHGEEFFAFTVETSKSNNGLAPTGEASRLYRKHKRLIDQAPSLAGLIVGPAGNSGEFSGGVYNWLFQAETTPGSGESMRENPAIADRADRIDEEIGWIEYAKLSTAIDVELRERKAQGLPYTLNANANSDLAILKERGLAVLNEQYPGWQIAYNERVNRLPEFLQGAYATVFDPSLDGRTDIEALRGYLYKRQQVQALLSQRQEIAAQQGVKWSNSLYFDAEGNPGGDNADVAAAWLSYVNELKSSNLFFAEIHTRWLEADDLSITVGGAS